MSDDADILSELSEIDDIVGEEVTFDEADLDFDLEGEPAAVQPEAEQPESKAPANRPEAKKPKAEQPDKAAKRPEAEQPDKAPAKRPEAEQPDKSPAKRSEAKEPKAGPKTVVERAKDSVTEVDEVVVRAKRLRIVADKVIIEPGDISFA